MGSKWLVAGGGVSARCAVALAIFAFTMAAIPLRAQDPPGELAASPESPALDDLTATEIEAAVQTVEADETIGTEDKEELRQRYREAAELLEAADRWQSRAAELAASAEMADQRRRELEAALAEPPEPGAIPDDATLADLEGRLAERTGELDKARTALAAAEAEPERRAARRQQLPALIAEQSETLEELDARLAAAPDPDEPARAQHAERTLLRARRQAIAAELAAYRAEQAAYDATRELLPLERDVAAKRVVILEDEAAALREAVGQRRREEAERLAAEARRELARAFPALRQIAQENVELAERRQELTQSIEAADAEAAQISERLSQLERQFADVRRMAETVGLTEALGALLRKNRAELPDVDRYRALVAARQMRLNEARWEWIELTRRRGALAPPDRAVDHVMAELPPDEIPLDQDGLRREIRHLLEAQRAALDPLIAEYDGYFERLVELDTDTRQLIQLAREYRHFIDERILWIRSAEPLRPADLAAASRAVSDFVTVREWRPLIEQWRRQGPESTVILALALVAVFPLVMLRRRLAQRLELEGEVAAKRTATTIRPTIVALGLTAVMAATWPALIAVVGWQIGRVLGDDPFFSAAAFALMRVAWTYLALELLRLTCVPGGLGESHFGWPPQSLARLRRHLRWLMPVFLLLFFLVHVIEAHPDEPGRTVVGRLAYLVAMLLLAVFLERILSPSRGILREALLGDPQSWLSRLRYFWFPEAVLLPLVLAGLAAWGYYYTALQLTWRVLLTFWLVLLIALLYAMLRRWLLMARRRLAMQQARERRELARRATAELDPDAESPTPIELLEEPGLALATIDEHTRRVLRAVVVTLFVVGLWMVWIDVLPALHRLQDVRLWPTTVQILERTTLPDGTVEPQIVPVDTWVTLADLALAILVVAVTIIATRNLPGLIEIIALDRLPLEPAIRFAISNVARYVIFLVGLIVVATMLGIRWNQVQWLAAAVTVGLGFGLQEIFANFVSGLIILFERPIRVGDIITLDGLSGTVTRIRMRATVITDWDRKEVVIPNKEFITGRVMNWTLSDTMTRIEFPIGVAYNTDLARAQEIILRVAKETPHILDEPAPSAYIESFSDSSIDFRLRAFVLKIEHRLSVIHALHENIMRAFREAGIEIAFPQRDLHVRSIEATLPVDAQENGQPGAGNPTAHERKP